MTENVFRRLGIQFAWEGCIVVTADGKVFLPIISIFLTQIDHLAFTSDKLYVLHLPVVIDKTFVFFLICFSIGRFDLNVAVYCCSCCQYSVDPLNVNQLLSEGYWPATLANSQYLFSKDLLTKWDLL